MGRGVFSTAERQLMQRLRDAVPQHVVLAKLPLVRLCQAVDPDQQRDWFELIGQTAVSFVVCAPNGRALTAFEFVGAERRLTRRAAQIQAGVLEACHIRLVQVSADALPSVADLRALVPDLSSLAPHDTVPRRGTLAHAVRGERHAARSSHWDSAYNVDSFFDRRDPRLEPAGSGKRPLGDRAARPDRPERVDRAPAARPGAALPAAAAPGAAPVAPAVPDASDMPNGLPHPPGVAQSW